MNLKFPKIIYFLGAILAGFFWLNFPHQLVSIAGQVIPSDRHETIDIEQLKHNDVVYLGENHDNPQHHLRQLKIITQLHQDNPRTELAIGMEMFQRPFQPVLNRYLAQEISEAEFKQQTEYDTRWGFDWEFYAPILRYARQQQISLIALNTPTEITRKVAETGIASLEGSDFRYIPPLTAIELDNPGYRQKLEEVYLQHVEDGQANSENLDNFFAAQVLWDETMAEAIALYYQNNPQSQIVILVGQAHLSDDYGIPDRVKRRIQDQNFRQLVKLM